MSDNGCLVEIDHLKVFFPIKQGFLIARDVLRPYCH